MARNTADEKENAESVNTEVVALPIPDVYLYDNDGTTHLVNGREYARARARGWDEATSMCGHTAIPVGPDDDLPENVEHYADRLTMADVNADAAGVMHLNPARPFCGNCQASYGRDGVPTNVNLVRFETDGSGWSR